MRLRLVRRKGKDKGRDRAMRMRRDKDNKDSMGSLRMRLLMRRLGM
jgi:hypothetical protein